LAVRPVAPLTKMPVPDSMANIFALVEFNVTALAVIHSPTG
jgi:hypothetical protein